MNNIIKCSECGSIKIYHSKDRGELICKDCGLVIEDSTIDFSKEWVEHDIDDSSKRRAGPVASELDVDKGLMTSFDLKGLPGKDFYKWQRLKRWQYRMTAGIERNLELAFQELKRIACLVKAPKGVEEEAARIYRQAAHTGLVKGRRIEIVIAGTLYAALRVNNAPRTLQELELASGADKKEIARAYRSVVRACGLKIPATDPGDFISRICTDLALPPKVESRALELSTKTAEKELLSGRNPLSVAAACVYLAALEFPGEKKTQRAVADAAGVTEVTIRNRYTEIIKEVIGADRATYKKYRRKVLQPRAQPKTINNNKDNNKNQTKRLWKNSSRSIFQ
jgi:transcription initiation factor TFIIB